MLIPTHQVVNKLSVKGIQFIILTSKGFEKCGLKIDFVVFK